MNNFTPKYIKMASTYLQESLDKLEHLKRLDEEKEVKILILEKKNSNFKNFLNWIFKH